MSVANAILCACGKHSASAWAAKVREGIWRSECQWCGEELQHSLDRGWQTCGMTYRPKLVGPTTTSRILALVTFLTLGAAAATAGAPQRHRIVHAQEVSLFHREIAQERQLGLQCRSAVDGSIADAVNQVKMSLPEGASFTHHDTYLGPERSDHYDLDMAFWVERDDGSRRLKEAYGSVDAQTCKTRLTKVTWAI